MATIYTVCFVIISYIVIAGKSEYHSSGLIGFLRRNLLAVSIRWLNYCSIIVFMSLHESSCIHEPQNLILSKIVCIYRSSSSLDLFLKNAFLRL